MLNALDVSAFCFGVLPKSLNVDELNEDWHKLYTYYIGIWIAHSKGILYTLYHNINNK